jgi:hypothetical protein
MPATNKQCLLIDELQTLGAVIPENYRGNPSNEMYESIAAADCYIKKWIHLMPSTKVSAGEWGGVLNC